MQKLHAVRANFNAANEVAVHHGVGCFFGKPQVMMKLANFIRELDALKMRKLSGHDTQIAWQEE